MRRRLLVHRRPAASSRPRATHDSPVGQRQQDRDAPQFARRERAARARRGRGLPRRRGARHHGAPARRSPAHHAGRRPCDRGGARAGAVARRVQHRRRSAARPARARPRGAPRSVHAGAGRARRDHQPGRLDGLRRRVTCRRWSATSRRRAFGSACSSNPPKRRSVSRRRSAPIASSSTRSRSRGRSSARARTAGGRSRRTPTPRSWRTRWAWASTPATTSISTISMLFRTLPHLDEVSIGHAIISRAVFVGLDAVVREYLAVLDGPWVMIECPRMKVRVDRIRRCRHSVRSDCRLDHRQPSTKRAARRRSTAAAPAAANTANQPPPLDEAKVTAFRASPSASRRTPRRACSSATCTSTPNGTTMRSSGTRRR